MNLLLLAFIVSIGINLLMFIPAFIYKTDKLTDASYSVTFIVVSVFAYLRSERSLSQTLLLICVLLWALRLGGFLLIRIRKMKRDKRFDGMRDNFFAFLRFWMLQGTTVFVVLLASLLFWRATPQSFSIPTFIGIALFSFGLAMEAIADLQKYRFNNDSKNKGRWIDVGVWRKSRHPNYLGEMLVWSGLYVAVFAGLSGSERLIGLLSPGFIIVLLLFVSGIPLLEKSADERWGADPEYKKYKKQVPVLLPTPRSWGR